MVVLINYKLHKIYYKLHKIYYKYFYRYISFVDDMVGSLIETHSNIAV